MLAILSSFTQNNNDKITSNGCDDDIRKKVERIDNIVDEILDMECENKYYVFHDEYEESWRWSLCVRPDHTFWSFSFILSESPLQSVSYYLDDNDKVCLINIVEIRPGYWHDEIDERYYIEEYNLFYYTCKHIYKEDVIFDTAYVRTEFTEEDPFPCYLDKESIEFVLNRSKSAENHY